MIILLRPPPGQSRRFRGLLLHRRIQIYESAATGEEHEIETALMHPLCKGSVDIRRYYIGHLEKSIMFPYQVVDGKAHLIVVSDFRSKYPKAWKCLLQNRDRLEAREGGKWKHDRWYAFGRSQNLSEMEQRKLLTPSIAASASFTLDDQSGYYFVGSGGGGGGGYGITIRPESNLTLPVLLAILNSSPADFFLKSVSTPFANGYFAYNRQFIEQIPIPELEASRHGIFSRLTKILLYLHHRFRTSLTTQETRDPLMLAYWERVLNGLVYELYFPEEVHAAGLRFFELAEQAELPDVDTIPEGNRLRHLRRLFENLRAGTHPLRIALDKLQTLDTIRIIEGKA